MKQLFDSIRFETTDTYSTSLVSQKYTYMEEFNDITHRLLSFSTVNLPSASSIYLANQGFYYHRESECIKCYLCGKLVENFQHLDSDNSRKLRVSHSPICHYRKQDGSGPRVENGIPSRSRQDENENRTYKKSHVSTFKGNYNSAEYTIGDFKCIENPFSSLETNDGDHLKSEQHQSKLITNSSHHQDQALDSKTTTLMYPEYAAEVVRRASFAKWRLSFLSPDTLSSCGFFYVGHGDMVRCFACGGGLKCWERSDDPWLEHCKWFPGCQYIRLKVGEDFVNTIQEGVRSEGENVVDKREKQRRTSSEDLSGLCAICRSQEASVQTTPCLHTACCRRCILNTIRCPVCTEIIISVQ